MRSSPRRNFLTTAGLSAAAVSCGLPFIARAQQPLSLGFLTIPDPDGWHSSLRLKGDWLVFEISDGVLSGYGEASTELKARTPLRVAGGELYWGNATFATLVENRWVDVIMPDVKHVGGFGPLLAALKMGRGRVEVSPHNPSGPISTAASLHAGALFPDAVRSLEYAFDRLGTRASTGEIVEDGYLYLNDEPGWGVEPPR